jgi:hypothetical protein
MATFHTMHEPPSRTKTLRLPQVRRHRPVVFNGNFGLSESRADQRCRMGTLYRVVEEQSSR